MLTHTIKDFTPKILALAIWDIKLPDFIKVSAYLSDVLQSFVDITMSPTSAYEVPHIVVFW